MTVEEMLTAKEGENFEFKTAEVFVGTVLADLADISDLGEIFICFDDLRLPWGQSPQVSAPFPTDKMSVVPVRRHLGGERR